MSPYEKTNGADASAGEPQGAAPSAASTASAVSAVSVPGANPLRAAESVVGQFASDVGVPARPRPVWIALAWTAVALYVFSLAFFPLRTSHDEWWHLKTGKWIVEHGMHLPEKDVFTYTATDYKWDNHEWLTEVAMYGLWRWGEDHDVGGWRLVVVVKALLLVAAYLLLGRFAAQRAGGGAVGLAVGVFVAVLAADVGRRMFWPRPPVVSNLFLVFYLYVLWLHRSGRLRTPWLLVLPFLMPLWANLHGGFLLGGMAVGAYAGGEAMEWAGGRALARRSAEAMRPQWTRAWTYAGLGVLCGLASLCNPFGYRVYLLSSRVMRDCTLVSRLSELLPPDFRFTWGFVFLAMFLAAGMAALLAATLEHALRPGRAGKRCLALAALFACEALAGIWLSSMHFARAVAMGEADGAEYRCCVVYAAAAAGVASAVGCLIAAWWAWRSARVRTVVGAGTFPAADGPVEWPPLADILIAGFFFTQALTHVRHMILFGIGAAPLAAWLLARTYAILGVAGRSRLRRTLNLLAAVIALWVVFIPGEWVGVAGLARRLVVEGPAAMRSRAGGSFSPYFAPPFLGFSQVTRNMQLLRGQEVVSSDYPIGAANFLLHARIPSDSAARLPGRLFNRNSSSGYLIWALSPEHYRLFTDSRFDVFGGDFIADEDSVVGVWTADEVADYYRTAPHPRPGLRDWHTVIAYWGINLLLVEKSEKVHGYLLRQCFQDWLTANAPADLARSFAQGDGTPDARLLAWLKAFPLASARRPETPASEWALIHSDAGFVVWLRRAQANEPWIDRYEDWTRTAAEFLREAAALSPAAQGQGERP
jgi:hypothetical protein